MSYLSIAETHVERDRVTFIPVKLSKHHRQGKKIKRITLKAYQGDPRLCVVNAVTVYKDHRQNLSSEDSLLLTHRKPHRSASRDTTGRWLKQVLTLSGVDPKVFGAHSYRGASSSAAKRAAIPIRKILRRGQWSSEHT